MYYTSTFFVGNLHIINNTRAKNLLNPNAILANRRNVGTVVGKYRKEFEVWTTGLQVSLLHITSV